MSAAESTVFAALSYGFGLSLSLIAAIGAQNIFVLKQGLQGKPVFWICLICALSDALLISLGVGGFQVVLMRWPWVEPLSRYGGALFLLLYGGKSLYNSWRPSGVPTLDKTVGSVSLWRDLAACLAFTFLNPHVYLDTLILLGSVSTEFTDKAAYFGLGAVLASFVFFFTLGYAAKRVRPLFTSPKTWRILDFGVGVLMWALAFKLVL